MARPAAEDNASVNPREMIDAKGLADDGKLRVQVWGHNVFNTYYWNSTFQADTVWKMAGRPATYGVTLGWRY